MPEIFRIFGLKFYFFSREHEPIHVHVKNADGNAKIKTSMQQKWFLKRIMTLPLKNGLSISDVV